MKFYRIRVDGTDFKVGVEKLRDGLYRVRIGDKEAEVVVEDIYERMEHESQSLEVVANEDVKDAVTTMLPGVVLKILVKPGDRVQAGDPVIIIESMKMENEIVSPRDGVVAEIFVKEGQRVEAGDVLAVIQ